ASKSAIALSHKQTTPTSIQDGVVGLRALTPAVRFRSCNVLSALVYIAFVCSVASSLSCYPHSRSYFNELAGGPMRGHQRFASVDSDWGQDLLRLRSWLQEHQEVRPLSYMCSGGVKPTLLGINSQRLAARDPIPGWHAVCLSALNGTLGSRSR